MKDDFEQRFNTYMSKMEDGISYFAPAIIVDDEVKMICKGTPLLTFNEAKIQLPEVVKLFPEDKGEEAIIEFKKSDQEGSIHVINIYVKGRVDNDYDNDNQETLH